MIEVKYQRDIVDAIISKGKSLEGDCWGGLIEKYEAVSEL